MKINGLNLIKVFDSAWGELPDQDNDTRLYLNGIMALAAYYLFQMILYRLTSGMSSFFLKPDGNVWAWAQVSQAFGTLVGGIVGPILLWRQRKKNYYRFNSLRRIINLSTLFLVAGTLLQLYWFQQSIHPYILYLARVLFGAGFACGIGCAILWICEYLPPHLRTSGAMFIGGIGFAGAAVTEFFLKICQQNDEITIYMQAASILLPLLLLTLLPFKLLPKDSNLNLIYDSEVQARNKENPADTSNLHSIEKTKLSQNLVRTIVYSLLLGISVQFFAFFTNNAGRINSPPGYEQKDLNPNTIENYAATGSGVVLDNKSEKSGDLNSFLRYIGMAIMCIVIARFSNWKWALNISIPCCRYMVAFSLYRKRTTPLALLLFLQFVFMLVVSGWWVNWYGLYNSLASNYLISLLSGILGSTWILSILTVAEQFNLKMRPWFVLLAPNVYRCLVDGVLLSRTWVNNGDSKFGSQVTLAIFLWGIVFTFTNWLASLGMKENFEGDALYLPDEEKLSDTGIREHIQEIPKENGQEEFLKSAGFHLTKHFSTILKEHYYGSGIYLMDSQKPNIIKIHFNENGSRVYSRPSSEAHEGNWHVPHLASVDLIEQGYHESFARAIFNDTKTRGGVLWLSGRPYILGEYMAERYTVVDLQDVKIPEGNEKKKCIAFFNTCEWEETAIQKARLLFRNIQPEIAEDLKKKNPENGLWAFEKDKKMLALFALFRVDAERYIPGHYFLHIIKPYTTECDLALMLKTAVPLSSKRLEELRALITFIELEMEKREQARTIIRLSNEEDHNRKVEIGWLKKQVRALASWEAWKEKPQPDFFGPKVKAITSVLDHLYELSRFNAHLLRAENIPEKIPIQEFEPGQINLNIMIDDIWTKIKESSEYIRFSNNQHLKAFNAFGENTPSLWTIAPSVWLHDLVETPLRVVLFELIKNAAEKTNPDHLSISIQAHLSEPGKGMKLYIENSVTPGVYIDTSLFSLDNSPILRGKAGIRSIKRYLNYFRKNGQDWNLSAQKTETSITVTVHIPEVCLLRSIEQIEKTTNQHP